MKKNFLSVRPLSAFIVSMKVRGANSTKCNCSKRNKNNLFISFVMYKLTLIFTLLFFVCFNRHIYSANQKAQYSYPKLYNQNKDEFTSKMAMTAKLGVIGTNLKKDNIIFSLRGCHLIAMLSRTSTAKEFRKWVLDILDEEISSITPTDIVLPSLIDAKPFRIKFNNQNIMLIQNPETSEIFFNINKICNNLGINSNTQRHRIRKERILNENIYKAKGLLNQISFYLPLKFLNEFLDGVYISRNNIHYKEQFQLLNLYQEECYNFINNELSKMNLLLNNSTTYLIDGNTKNNNNTKNIIVLDKRKQIIEYLTPFISSQEINCIISKYKNDDYILANIRSLFSHYNNSKIDIYIIKSVLDNDLACYWSS